MRTIPYLSLALCALALPSWSAAQNCPVAAVPDERGNTVVTIEGTRASESFVLAPPSAGERETFVSVRSRASGLTSTLVTRIANGAYLRHSGSVAPMLLPFKPECDDSNVATASQIFQLNRYSLPNGRDAVTLFHGEPTGPGALVVINLDYEEDGSLNNISTSCQETSPDFDLPLWLTGFEEAIGVSALTLAGTSSVNNAECATNGATADSLSCAERTECEAPFLASTNEELIYSVQDGVPESETTVSPLKAVRGMIAAVATADVVEQRKVARKAARLLQSFGEVGPLSEPKRATLKRAVFVARVAGKRNSSADTVKRYLKELTKRVRQLQRA